jgi:hypothetical protein
MMVVQEADHTLASAPTEALIQSGSKAAKVGMWLMDCGRPVFVLLACSWEIWGNREVLPPHKAKGCHTAPLSPITLISDLFNQT